VRRYGVDAAIFFSDIVVPLKAVGVELDIVPGVGPVVAQPFRTEADLDRLPALTPQHVPYITESVRSLTGELGATPLIGFAGAPFTLASYLVEGGPSKNHAATKALMYGRPDLWAELLDRLRTITLGFLRVQIDAGVSAVQLFDSWVGALPAADYRGTSSRTAPGCWRPSPTCRASTSASAPASCCTTWAGRRGRRRRRLAGAAVGRRAAHRPGQGRCRATSTRRWSSRPRSVVEPQGREVLEEGRREGTCSTRPRGAAGDRPDALLRVVELVARGAVASAGQRRAEQATGRAPTRASRTEPT
jgi:hypothetical protein